MSRIYQIEKIEIESLIVIPEIPPVITVSAEGWTVTSGWSQPELAPWMYIMPPKDGILDLDFIATPPTGIALQVLTRIAVTMAFVVPDWVQGVRIHASQNNMTAMPKTSPQPTPVSPTGEGLPLPWPFPWWAPKSK